MSLEPASLRTPIWGWNDVLLFFGLGLPLILLAQIALGLLARLFHQSPTSAWVQIAGQTAAYGALFLLLAGILRMQYDAPFWRSLGWVPSRVSPLIAVVCGMMLAVTLAILGALLNIPNVDTPMRRLLESPNGAVLLTLFGILVAPLTEELAFRGFLQPLMVRTLGTAGGIGLTALLFGMLHWQQNAKSWASAGLIALAGVGFGVLRHLAGSTRSSILAHVAYNSLLFLAFFANGRKTSI